MAQKVLVQLEDDIDGSEATETVAFGLDGASYEIDLNKKHADSLREACAPYVESARKVGRMLAAAPARSGKTTKRRNGVNTDGISTEEVRAWARHHGYKINDRGRIPSAIMAEFKSAQGAYRQAPAPAAAAPQAEPETEPVTEPPAKRGGRTTAAEPATEAAAPARARGRKSRATAASTTS